MVRTLPLDSETRPELSRILAIAAVIAVHVLAFFLLLVPLANSPVEIPTPRVERWKIPMEMPRTLPPPEQLEVVKKQEIRHEMPQPAVRQSQTADPAIVEAGTIPTSPEPSITLPATNDLGSIDTIPMQGAQLETITATAPRYPRAEAMSGVQGRVMLRILVGIDGRPVEVTVQKSSGNRNLDRTAREHVLKSWTFKPAMRNGQPVQAYGVVPIDFTLQ